MAARRYDELDSEHQAMVRDAWAERIQSAIDALDLAVVFSDEGRSWVELDDHGRVIERRVD